MNKIVFNAATDYYESNEFVTMAVDTDAWTEQADVFFRFLLAQGYIVSELDVADHFLDAAMDMKDYRSNERRDTKEESECRDSIPRCDGHCQHG